MIIQRRSFRGWGTGRLNAVTICTRNDRNADGSIGSPSEQCSITAFRVLSVTAYPAGARRAFAAGSSPPRDPEIPRRQARVPEESELAARDNAAGDHLHAKR